MAVAGYLEKYFECVESLPLELQRYVTQLREVEIEAQGVVDDIKSLRSQLSLAVRDGDDTRQQVVFRQLQECVIKTRDFGNNKLEISSNLLGTVEDYNQQLTLRGKAIDPSSNEEFYHAQRNATVYGNNHSSSKDTSSNSNGNGYSETKSVSKRPAGTKRVRPPPVDRDDDSNGGRTRESSTTPSTGNSQHTSNGRSAKKKVKTIKKKNAVTPKVAMTTEKDSPPPLPSAHVPMPDLTSQPLDPDEPTYCLCQQVSFGEMIGCDNDDCPIEWFHFQCVNLTSKPKGKWYCPQCSQARKNKISKSLV